MQEDARKTGLKDGLRQLDYEQLLRVKNYPGQMVLDTYNFDRGLFCPLAIGVGLDRIKQEWTHDTVFHYLTMKGLKVNNTVGIEGSFYTCNRHADLMTAVDGVLEEKPQFLEIGIHRSIREIRFHAVHDGSRPKCLVTRNVWA